MAQTRLCLHKILCDILGSEHCYYSPPTSLEMVYPCICYDFSGNYTKHANNNIYIKKRIYNVIVIDEDPDSIIPDMILDANDIPYCSYDRTYVSDGLYHFALTVYF